MIKIRNIGPVKEAILSLNKINVFMGPQSSGKSTIAKIISYCTWVEKDVATSQSLSQYQKGSNTFKEHLEKYHRLKGYFKPDSFISYSSDVLDLQYSAGKLSISWKDRYAYKRSKISYIPSERNMVILNDLKNVEFGDTNIRSFLFDWRDTRANYSKKIKMPVLGLDMEYYYNENSDEDHIVRMQNGDSYDILLSNASSGLQSVTPLLAMIDYLTGCFYNQEEKISSVLNERKRQTNQILIEDLILKKYFIDNRKRGKEEIDKINEKIRNKDKQVKQLVAEWRRVEKKLFSTHNTQFIIEEPEQNLFPETQRDLVYYLLEKCLDVKREHRLIVTTHSPYILYALNNCMLGHLVYDRMSALDKKRVKCQSSLIDPQKVSIYQIRDGITEPIQQEDGLIGANYFDQNMKTLMDDFYVFLNYYGK